MDGSVAVELIKLCLFKGGSSPIEKTSLCFPVLSSVLEIFMKTIRGLPYFKLTLSCNLNDQQSRAVSKSTIAFRIYRVISNCQSINERTLMVECHHYYTTSISIYCLGGKKSKHSQQCSRRGTDFGLPRPYILSKRSILRLWDFYRQLVEHNVFCPGTTKIGILLLALFTMYTAT